MVDSRPIDFGYNHAHNPQNKIITIPIPNLAKNDQPQPVIHALVLSKAACLSFILLHSARNKPTGEATMPARGVKNKLTIIPAANDRMIELHGISLSSMCLAMMILSTMLPPIINNVMRAKSSQPTQVMFPLIA